MLKTRRKFRKNRGTLRRDDGFSRDLVYHMVRWGLILVRGRLTIVSFKSVSIKTRPLWAHWCSPIISLRIYSYKYYDGHPCIHSIFLDTVGVMTTLQHVYTPLCNFCI